MKTRLLWALLCWLSLICFGAQAQTLLAQETFEGASTDFGYTNSTITAPYEVSANVEYFQRVAFTSSGSYPGTTQVLSNQQGSYTWAGEGVRGTGVTNIRPPGYVALKPIVNSQSFKNFAVTVALAAPRGGLASGAGANSAYNTDKIRIQYSFNGGAWTTIALFMGNNALGSGQGGNLQQILPLSDSTNVANGRAPAGGGTVLTAAYQDITTNLPTTALGSNLRVRVVLDIRAVEVAFDNIRVTGVADNNAKPTLSNIESTAASYTEGGSPVQLTNNLTVGYSDNSATTITGATVAIGGGFVSGQDVLNFTNQPGITGSYDTGTGVLTLSGTTTQANYQAALRSITYANNSTSTATSGTRTITFQVTNGSTLSTTASRNLTVTAVLNAPVALNYTENFDTNGEGTRYFGNSFVSISQQTGFFRATNSPATSGGSPIGSATFTGWSGGYWYGEGTAEGINNPTAPTSTLQLAPVDTRNRSSIKFTIALGASSGWQQYQDAANPGESFELYYRINGGTPVKFGAFYGANGTARQDADLDKTTLATGTALSTTLQDITFALPAAVAGVSNLDFLLVQQTRGGAELAFDNIRITGLTQTTVNSLVRASANPTNAATVNYTVTFGAPVTGLTAANFSLTTTGSVSGASVGTPVSTGSTWTVPVTTGSGSGTLTLNLANDNNLSVDVTTTLPFAGETYVIDKTAPAVSSSNRQSPAANPTAATSLTYRVTFSEAVVGVTTSSFTFTTTGGTTGTIASVASVSGSNGTQYDVTVNSVNGNGTGRLDVNSSGSGITDAAGNALSGGFTGGQPYTISQSVTVVSVTRLGLSPTATAQVRYQVVFSGSVASLTPGNFTLTVTSGSISGAMVGSVSPGPSTTYTVTVNTGTGNGMLRLNVDNSTGITPTVSSLPYTAGETYTISKSFPAASRLTIVGTGGTGSDVTAFVDQVRVVQNGTSTVVSGGVQNGSFESNNVPASDFKQQQNGVVAAPWSFTLYGGVARTGSAFGNATAPDGDAVAVLQSKNGTNGSASQNLAVPTGSYQLSFQAAQRNCCTTGDQALNVFLNDRIDNVFLGTIQPSFSGSYNTFTSATFTVTAPALTATVSGPASPTSTAPLPFTVNFTQSVGTTFVESDVTVLGGTLTSGSFGGSGAGPYTFTVTPTGTGTVSVSLAANVAQDDNNTGNSASNSGNPVSVQYTQPVTAAPVITDPANGTLTNQAVTFTGTAPAGSAVLLYVSQGGTAVSGSPFSVAALADGTFSFGPYPFGDGTYQVYATAQTTGSSVSANSNTNTFTVDITRPSVLLTSSSGASGSTNVAAPFAFRATFSEAVSGFVAGDLSVTNGTVSNFVGTAGGSVYTFTVTPNTLGAVTSVYVFSNSSQDAAGNGNTVSNTYSLTSATIQVATAAPVVTAPTNNSFTNQAVTFTGTAPAGSTVLLYVSQGGTAVSGSPFSVAALADGSFSFGPTTLPEGTYQVYATAQSPGAGVSANSNTNTFTVDITRPAVLLTSSSGASGSTNVAAPFAFKATFSEAVSGFVAGDLSVTNGTVTNFVGTAGSSVYTFDVTPNTPGTATTVNVPANVAQDAAGNFNRAAPDAYTITYSPPVAPTLTAVAPTPGGLGQAITLMGTGLGSPTALTINGANALAGLVSNSGTSLVVRVPVTAASAGTVSITTAQGTATLPFTVLAPPGNALAFDGVDDYLALPATTPVPVGNTAYTVEAWVNPNTMNLGSILGWGNYGATNQANGLSLNSTGLINYWWGNDLQAPTASLVGHWHHVAATYDGTTRTLYLDGVALGTDVPGAHTVPDARNLRIGSNSNGNYTFLNGRLDEVRVYTVALTSAQLRADMLSPTASVPASLVLYYNFDQGTPATASTGDNAPYTTLYDLSPNATPATLNNFALASGNTSSNYVQSYALAVPTATAATSQTSTSFIATWTAPAVGTVTSYLLDVSTTPDFAAPVTGAPFPAAASATSYGVTGLTQNTTYYYRVRALNSALTQPDQGAFSNTSVVATPLPVELVRFTATAEGRSAVRLAWATASERNSARFEVERSLDGTSFQPVGAVAAAGTTVTAHAYALRDAALPSGTSLLYYRLRQVDQDGAAHYSVVRSVTLAGATAGLSLYPNPVRSGTVTLLGAVPGTQATVLDAVGRAVLSAPVDATGKATLDLPPGLATGVYLVRAGAQALRLAVE